MCSVAARPPSKCEKPTIMSIGSGPVSMICTTGQPALSSSFRAVGVWSMPETISAAGRWLRNTCSSRSSSRPGIMRVAELDAERAVRQAVIDAAHHFGEDVVGERRHQHAEHLGARRGQRPRIRVGHIAEFVDGALDLAAQAFRDAFRLAQRPRHGDGADAGQARDIGDGRPAAATARARPHGLPISVPSVAIWPCLQRTALYSCSCRTSSIHHAGIVEASARAAPRRYLCSAR